MGLLDMLTGNSQVTGGVSGFLKEVSGGPALGGL